AVWSGFMIFAVSAVIVAVALPEISKTFSTNLSEGGGLETARNLVILIVLLLAGALAQRWGKKRFLSLGQYLVAAGLVLASFSQSYPMLIFALLIMGLGGGFSEALLNPLIVDIHHQGSGRYLNLSHAFYPTGIVGSALLFGELLTLGYSWRLMFQIAALGALVVAIIFTLLRFPPAEKDESSYAKLFASVLALGGFWLFASAIFLGGSIEAALTFWSRSYVETYLSDVPRSGAVALVIFAGVMAIGRLLSAYLANKTSLNNIMIGSAILGIGVTALIPFATTLLLFYSLLGLAGLATACFWPTILAEADSYLKVNTTILFVLLSGVGIIGFGLTPWIMGVIGDNAELKAGFAIIPVLFAGLIAVLIVESRLSRKAAKNLGNRERERHVV
ncbi:MAG: MFS transporter, partial [Candidatus Promineifilaceae bacterium]